MIRIERPVFWATAAGVVALDFITKRLAVASLSGFPRSVISDWLNLQLVYNPGAAFGIGVGQYSRVVFSALAIAALIVLGLMVRNTDESNHARLAALALICGGAFGNLIDRFISSRGVVDFIDVGIGTMRWPTFNIADTAVTCGAIVLAFVLSREGKEATVHEAPSS
ncbi:MAG: signal peptidase II [Gemmatimonadetes bacterium]|nr:signal peptidase II [Gemmatimonadota bacterium]